jgi:hypothetical protein
MIALDAGGFKAAIDAFMVAKRVSLLVLLSGTVGVLERHRRMCNMCNGPG